MEPKGPVYRNFILDEQRGFIFAYVPKVACTNWKAVMRYLAGHADWLDSKLAHDKQNGGLHYIDLKGPEREILADPGIPKYACVRDPYSRSLSAYLNKVEQRLASDNSQRPDDHFDAIARTIDEFRVTSLDPDAYPVIDFEVFLRWLREGKSHYRHDEHWARQTSLLRFGEVEYDYLGRFERLDEDGPAILSLMGADVGFPTQKDVKFSPQGTGEKLQAYLTPPCRSLIEELYASDFEAYGYPLMADRTQQS